MSTSAFRRMFQIGRTSKAGLLVSSCLALGFGSVAAAQTPIDDGAQDIQAASDTDATEIVVSAKRIGVTEQTAPIAVTGLNAGDIQARGIADTRDLQTNVPGLNAGIEVGIPKLFIRGIGQESSTIGQDPAVTTYLDGVPIGRNKAFYVTQVDLARVEVLRGPQGTLFGRNATAGAVNYITQRPTGELEASATAGLGNYNSFNIGATLNVPLASQWAIRLAGMHTERDGFVRNLGDGPDRLDDQNVESVRGSLQFKGTGLTAVLAGDYTNERSNGPAFLFLNPALIPGVGISPDDYVIANGRRVTKATSPSVQPSFTRTQSYGANLTLELDLADNIQAKSITAYRGLKHAQAQDSDATAAAFVGAFLVSTTADQFTQEFNIAADLGRFNAVIGAFGFYEDALERNDVAFFQGFAPPFDTPALLVYDSNLRSTSLAAFADGSFEITPSIRLNAGFRYTHDEKKNRQSSYLRFGSLSRDAGFLVSNCGTDPSGAIPNSVNSKFSKGKLTWKAGVDADLSDNAFGYATVSTGYKAGGFTDFSLCGLTFKPETVTNYEAGLKFRLFDNRGTLRITGYYQDYEDLQVQRVVSFGTQTINADGAKIYGLEIEGAMELNDMFKIDTAISRMHSEYKSFLVDYPLKPGTFDLVGRRLPRTPKWTVNLGLEGKLPMANDASLTARMEGYYSSALSLNPASDPSSPNLYGSEFDVQRAYAIGNAYVTYETKGGALQIRGWVRNFTNKFYLAAALPLPLPGLNAGFAAPPRTYGLDVTVRY